MPKRDGLEDIRSIGMFFKHAEKFVQWLWLYLLGQSLHHALVAFTLVFVPDEWNYISLLIA